MVAGMPCLTCMSTRKQRSALRSWTTHRHQQHRPQAIATSRVAMSVAATAELRSWRHTTCYYQGERCRGTGHQDAQLLRSHVEDLPGACSVNASHSTTTLQQYSAARPPITPKPCVTQFGCKQAHETWPHGTCLKGVQCDRPMPGCVQCERMAQHHYAATVQCSTTGDDFETFRNEVCVHASA